MGPLSEHFVAPTHAEVEKNARVHVTDIDGAEFDLDPDDVQTLNNLVDLTSMRGGEVCITSNDGRHICVEDGDIFVEGLER